MQSSPPGWHYPFSRESPTETFSLIGACQAYPGSQWENRRITISLFGTFIDLHCSLLQCLGRKQITQFHRKEMASLWMESGVAWHNPEEKGTLFISVFLFFFLRGGEGIGIGFLFTPHETWIFVRFRTDFFPFGWRPQVLPNHTKIMSTVELSN